MVTPVSTPLCAGFDGNTDFYGLGIRVGVYLQLVASWISNTLNPEVANDNHDANSTFLFAIIIAVLNAILQSGPNGPNLKSIEAWIVLQICFAFLFTVVSIFGLRIYLLQASTTKRLFSMVISFLRSLKIYHTPVRSVAALVNSMAQGRIFDLVGFKQVLKNSTVPFSLRTISFIRHNSLSWGGAIWRVAIAMTLIGANLKFWFGFQGTPVDPECYPTVYFFGRLTLHGKIIVFFKAVSVIIAIPVIYLGLTVCWALSILSECLVKIFLRKYEIEIIALAKPNFWDSTNTERRGQIAAYIDSTISKLNIIDPGKHNPLLGIFHSTKWLEDRDAVPSFARLFELYAFLFSAVEVDNSAATNDHSGVGWEYWCLTLMWHTWTGLTVVWFILSIELTITWNHINGVNTIASTGQLIPFIIGLTSFVRAAHEALLAIIKKNYPNYSNIDLIVINGLYSYELHIPQGRTDRRAQTGLQDPSGRWC